MLTLESAKLFLRIDVDAEDALIISLIDSAVAYITETTGLTSLEQETEPLAEMLQKFLLANWYENRADGGNMTGNSTIFSLVKTLKAKKTAAS